MSEKKDRIIAVVTADRDLVGGGGVPFLYARDQKDAERIALYLSRVMRAMVHDLENGVYVIVVH